MVVTGDDHMIQTFATNAADHTLRSDVVQSLVRRHLERRANLGFHLWGLMILFLWMRKWQIQPTPYSEARGEPLERVLTFS